MLKFTLILPSDEGEANRLLREAIDDLQVILMIVVGPNEQWVRWADQLAARGQGSGLTDSFRRVVWIHEAGPQVRATLDACLAGQAPAIPGVMVLNFHDKVCAVVQPADIRPLTLEEAFLKGNL